MDTVHDILRIIYVWALIGAAYGLQIVGLMTRIAIWGYTDSRLDLI